MAKKWAALLLAMGMVGGQARAGEPVRKSAHSTSLPASVSILHAKFKPGVQTPARSVSPSLAARPSLRLFNFTATPSAAGQGGAIKSAAPEELRGNFDFRKFVSENAEMYRSQVPASGVAH